jgi:hypothetical protein
MGNGPPDDDDSFRDISAPYDLPLFLTILSRSVPNLKKNRTSAQQQLMYDHHGRKTHNPTCRQVNPDSNKMKSNILAAAVKNLGDPNSPCAQTLATGHT